MIGVIEALLDESVDIDRPVLPRALTRMQQHVLDDRVRALAVLHDLLAVEVRASKRFPQFVNELDRDSREIVDEIEQVLDFVGNASGQLTERG
jgi:hypothetical protein